MDLPKNYQQAKEFFDGRKFKRWSHRPAGNNTEIHCLTTSKEPGFSIKFHATHIVTFVPDGRVVLDCYDSRTTNDRRSDAGMPTIHSFKHQPGGQFLCEPRRWWVWHGPNGRYPKGLPADRNLILNPDGTVQGEHTEEVWVPRVEDQRERKALLRWTRKHLLSVVHSMEQLEAFPPGIATWPISPSDLLGLKEKWEDANTDDQRSQEISDFINRELEITPMDWRTHFHVAKALDLRLKDMTPSAALKGDNDYTNPPAELWDRKTVRCEDIDQYI